MEKWEMTDYRIAPYGATEWKVQRRFMWLWVDVIRSAGYDLLERITFDTVTEAKEWIDAQLAFDAQQRGRRFEAARRRREIAPREYP
jgi:hypothetical protein